MIATLQAIYCYFGKYGLSLMSVFQKYCYQLVMKMATQFQDKILFHNKIFS